MDLILIRHARPERVENVEGGADPALTELGHRQAAAMAHYLSDESIDTMYVSPMRRARETAVPLEAALGLTATVVDGIAEFDQGMSSYIPGEEMGPMSQADMEEYFAAMTSDSFAQRVEEGLAGVIAANSGKTAAVVCHGGVISNFLGGIFERDRDDYLESNYTAITRIRASATSGRRTMISFNECHWLKTL